MEKSSSNLIESPLYQILKIVNLESYAEKLAELGYSHDLRSLSVLSTDRLANLYHRIQLPPEQIIKFQDIIELMKYLKPRKAKRSASSNKNPGSPGRLQRTTSVCSKKLEQSQFENLESLYTDYKTKIEKQEENEKIQASIKLQLEEAKRKLEDLTKQLYQSKELAEGAKKQELRIDRIGLEPLPKIDSVRKEVGVSYDSSKLRSTLSHLDIEEMCRCLAKAIKKHVSHSLKVNKSRESLVGISAVPALFGLSSEQLDKGVQVDSAVIKLFKQEFDDREAFAGRAPSETDIYNYCKNIIFRTKMEKECSIICLIYIERMIQGTGLYINEKNWKKLTYISLIIGSKVWDDESYENIHFAKAFTKYKLKELNSMERLFLELIEYSVGIKKSEYARYYFILRTFAEKNKRSFPLKPLDVDTVRRIQINGHRAEERLKDIHSKSTLKTT